MAGEQFLKAIKSVADNAIPYTELTNALYGKVLNIKPLTIRIENRFEISESDGNLQVSPLCMENYIHFPKHHHHYSPPDGIPHQHVHHPEPDQQYPAPSGCHDLENIQIQQPLTELFPQTHTTHYTTIDFDRILLWRGLLIGDNVLVLRVSRGQEYVVLYRLGNYSRDERITDGGGYR